MSILFLPHQTHVRTEDHTQIHTHTQPTLWIYENEQCLCCILPLACIRLHTTILFFIWFFYSFFPLLLISSVNMIRSIIWVCNTYIVMNVLSCFPCYRLFGASLHWIQVGVFISFPYILSLSVSLRIFRSSYQVPLHNSAHCFLSLSLCVCLSLSPCMCSDQSLLWLVFFRMQSHKWFLWIFHEPNVCCIPMIAVCIWKLEIQYKCQLQIRRKKNTLTVNPALSIYTKLAQYLFQLNLTFRFND